MKKRSALLNAPFAPKIEKEPIQHGHLPTLDYYDNKAYSNKEQTARRTFLPMGKSPRKIDFLDGQDHGPITVEEGQRYTREQKRAYLLLRITKGQIGERRKEVRRNMSPNPLIHGDHGIPTILVTSNELQEAA